MIVVIAGALAVLFLVGFAFGEEAARGLAQTALILLVLAVVGVIALLASGQ